MKIQSPILDEHRLRLLITAHVACLRFLDQQLQRLQKRQSKIQNVKSKIPSTPYHGQHANN